MNIIKYLSLLSVSLLATLFCSPVYSMERTAPDMNGLDAVQYENLVQRLVTKLNTLDRNGQAALLNKAIDMGSFIFVKALIAAGANLEAENSRRSPLENAIIRRHLDIAHALITAGAHLDVQDDRGLTALHHAVISDSFAIAHELITAGANLDAQDERGETPLHFLMLWQHIGKLAEKRALAQALIAAGANLNAKDNYCKTPLQYACPGENKEMVELLTEAQQRIEKAKLRSPIVANILALATHDRLGAESPLALLPYEGNMPALLRNISKLIADAEEHDARQPRP